MYVEAPTEWEGPGAAIFLAGGITDCPDWQAEARRIIGGVTVLNPRREKFPIDDPSAAEEQIAWEFRHLHRASVVLFWFAPGPSPQPIALYELGRHAGLKRPIVVGAHPSYLRVEDVHQQLRHARPEVEVFDALEHTCMAAVMLVNSNPRDPSDPMQDHTFNAATKGFQDERNALREELNRRD